MHALSSVLLLGLASATFACGGAAASSPAPAVPSRPPVSPAAAACAVWDREVDFARTVQAHDARAFAEHLHRGATFVSGDKLLRGPAEISEAWKVFLVGEKAHIDWHPTSVVLTGDQHLALSRGPFWIEWTKPDASPRFVTGTFQSVWQEGADGVWRVTVDGGGPEPVAATAADVEKIKAGLGGCPTGG